MSLYGHFLLFIIWQTLLLLHLGYAMNQVVSRNNIIKSKKTVIINYPSPLIYISKGTSICPTTLQLLKKSWRLGVRFLSTKRIPLSLAPPLPVFCQLLGEKKQSTKTEQAVWAEHRLSGVASLWKQLKETRNWDGWGNLKETNKYRFETGTNRENNFRGQWQMCG